MSSDLPAHRKRFVSARTPGHPDTALTPLAAGGLLARLRAGITPTANSEAALTITVPSPTPLPAAVQPPEPQPPAVAQPQPQPPSADWNATAADTILADVEAMLTMAGADYHKARGRHSRAISFWVDLVRKHHADRDPQFWGDFESIRRHLDRITGIAAVDVRPRKEIRQCTPA